MSIITLLVLLNHLAFPPSLSQEFEIDPVVTYGASFDNIYYSRPALAFNSEEYLIVRSMETYIYGVRVNLEGGVIDTLWLLISSEEGPVDIASDGKIWFVVWSQGSEGVLRFTRINEEGENLDLPGVPFLSGAAMTGKKSVCFGSGKFLVVAGASLGSVGGIFGVFVSPEGEVLDTFLIYTSKDYACGCPQVSSDGENFLIIWEESAEFAKLVGVRISKTGRIFDSHPIEIADLTYGIYGQFSISFGRSNYLVVRQIRYINGNAPDLRGTLISKEGKIIKKDFIIQEDNWATQTDPDIGFDGENFLVVWSDNRLGSAWEVGGKIVSEEGVVLSDSIIDISAGAPDYQWRPAVAFGDTNYLVVWLDHRTWPHLNIFGARVEKDGTVIDSSGIPISLSGDIQYSPIACFGDSVYFLTWANERREEPFFRINGSILSKSGEVLRKYYSLEKTPIGSICSGKEDFLLTQLIRPWALPYGYGSILCKFISKSSWEIRDSIELFGFDEFILGVKSTAIGDKFLIIATEAETNYDEEENELEIVGANLSGCILDENNKLSYLSITSQEWHYEDCPSLAWNGEEAFLVYQSYERDGYEHIYGLRISSSGKVLDSLPIEIANVSYANQYSPVVATDGKDFLVVWLNEKNREYHIYGIIVDESGEVHHKNGIPIITTSSFKSNPQLVYLGRYFLLAWEDKGSGKPTGIQAAILKKSGKVIETFPIAISEYERTSLNIAVGPKNECLMLYQGYVPQYGSIRVLGKILKYIEPGIEDTNDDSPKICLTAFPNPFKNSMLITLILPPDIHPDKVQLHLYDVCGKLIKTFKWTGNPIIWEGNNNFRKLVPSGIYFLALKVKDKEMIKKIVLIN